MQQIDVPTELINLELDLHNELNKISSLPVSVLYMRSYNDNKGEQVQLDGHFSEEQLTSAIFECMERNSTLKNVFFNATLKVLQVNPINKKEFLQFLTE